MRNTVIMTGLLGLLTSVCHATDYYIWKGAAADSVTTYSKYNVANSSGTDTGTAATGEIPSGSVVFIPANTTYHVDDDTADFCGALGGLRPQGSGAVVELSLSSDHSFGCYIYGASSQVIKSGAGTLTLTADGTDLVANNRRLHYCASWLIVGGEVVFWPSAAEVTYNIQIQSITIEAGATARLPPGAAVVYVPGFISGGGTLAHEADGSTGTIQMTGNQPTALFTGTITGNVRLQIYGRVNLKTASNDFTGGVQAFGAAIGFSDLGNDNAETSSIGKTSNVNIFNGLTLTNLIDEAVGEKTSARSFRYYGSSSDETYMLRFDGGECGKFTYTGSLQVYCNKVLSCVLQGAHPNPCTFNPFKVARASSYKGWFMLTKRGAGTWKMSGDSCYNSNFGGLMIEDGVLQMARIKAIGASSGGYTSCGWLTNVTQFCGYAYKGAVDDAPSPVGYAIRLGKADDLAQCGILEYIGNENVSCLNRAFALTGRGGFKNETDKNFIIGPIASEPLPEGGDAPVLNTLVLESSSASVNETRNITENAGAIRIEKRGTGTWILNENIGFTGGVDIQGGTLVVSNQANYVVLPNGLDYVSTRSGTTLKTIGDAVTINALTIDASQGLGNIDNCAFAATGTIYLTNFTEKETQAFSADLSAAGLANLRNWTVVINGIESTEYKVRANSTGLSVTYVKPGFILIVR